MRRIMSILVAMITTTFAQRLRTALGVEITAAEFARNLKKSGRVTVSRMAVSKWLNGKTDNVRMHHLVQIADHLHVDLRWLMTGEGDRKTKTGDRPSLSVDEQLLLGNYRSLPEHLRKAVREHLERLATPAPN